MTNPCCNSFCWLWVISALCLADGKAVLWPYCPLTHTHICSAIPCNSLGKLRANLLHGGSPGPWGPFTLDTVAHRCGLPVKHWAVAMDPQFPAGGEGAAARSGLDRTRDMLHWTTQTCCCRSNWLQSRNESPIHCTHISFSLKDNRSWRTTTAKQTRINDSHYGCQQPQYQSRFLQDG